MKNCSGLLCMLAVVALTGCAPNNPPVGIVQPTTVAATNTAPSAATPPPAPPTAAPEATVQAGQEFAIDQRATSTADALAQVALEVRSARIDPGVLVLRVAFVNITDESFQVLGGVGGAAARLRDAAGTEYEPIEVPPSLQAISPEGGFSPGTANLGELTFDMPAGGEPYELRFPQYSPITFQLDTPLARVAERPIAPGSYSLEGVVRSQQEALRTIELRFSELNVQDDTLVFDLAFANVGRQGFSLLGSLAGDAARLIDAEGQSYEPTEISASLADSIAPPDGWQPQQENAGQITFPRPESGERLRFVFPSFDTLTIEFDGQGQAVASVTSASGGAPAPTVQPSAEEQTYAAIEALLAKQAAATLAGDIDAVGATFDPSIQQEQATILQRLTSLPVISYTLRLAPDAAPGSGSTATRVPVELRYTLRGINPENQFHHDLDYSFAERNGEWLITNTYADQNPPFWWLDDVVVRETPHFLIFTRPDAQAELAELEQETEQAYATLQARGLALEDRYLAYFTATRADFTKLTGRGERYLGLALSRYEFAGDAIVTTSRAFYINGASFEDNSERLAPDERQTTITHELVHLALSADTRPFSPPWLVEGAAVFYSEETGGETRQRVAQDDRLAAASLEALTRAGALGEHDPTGQQAGFEYAFSGETLAYLVERFGEPAVLAFYRDYAAIPAQEVRDQLPQFGGGILAD
ncbi:MAG: hypothetical protein H7Z42_00785, partial [Roseiflexaceae bacterium]|nr:hypothetical protein [Roseiflexaceae bacterium]